MECGVPGGNVRVIPNGINVGEPIGKSLAKQHTAALFDKPIFSQQPIIGLISGFEPNYGAKLISRLRVPIRILRFLSTIRSWENIIQIHQATW